MVANREGAVKTTAARREESRVTDTRTLEEWLVRFLPLC